MGSSHPRVWVLMQGQWVMEASISEGCHELTVFQMAAMAGLDAVGSQNCLWMLPQGRNEGSVFYLLSAVCGSRPCGHEALHTSSSQNQQCFIFFSVCVWPEKSTAERSTAGVILRNPTHLPFRQAPSWPWSSQIRPQGPSPCLRRAETASACCHA